MEKRRLDRLYLLDKCTNGSMTNYQELTGALFDDMQILYNALHPVLETVTIETFTYERGDDRSVTFLVRTDSSINADTVLIPKSMPVEVSGRDIKVHIPLTLHAGGEDD